MTMVPQVVTEVTETALNVVVCANNGNKNTKTVESKRTPMQVKTSSCTKIPPGKNNGINSRKKILHYRGY